MSELREAAEEALRWMEHARLHLTIKERMHPDGLSLYDSATEALRAALAQPEAPCYVGDARKHVICVCPDCVATNYREWCEAVHAELVTTWTFSAENKDDPRKALQDIINWHVSVSLDPAVSSDAQALIERGKAMRDEWRLASEPPEDGRRVLIWVATESGGETFRPAYCPVGGWTSVFDGETLVAWRDVTPPGSDNIHNIRPLYAHPPRDEWRLASEPPEDLRRRVIAWRSPPQRQSGTWVEALYDDGAWVTRDGIAHDITHWRDVTPPTEGRP